MSQESDLPEVTREKREEYRGGFTRVSRDMQPVATQASTENTRTRYASGARVIARVITSLKTPE